MKEDRCGDAIFVNAKRGAEKQGLKRKTERSYLGAVKRLPPTIPVQRSSKPTAYRELVVLSVHLSAAPLSQMSMVQMTFVQSWNFQVNFFVTANVTSVPATVFFIFHTMFLFCLQNALEVR